MSLKQIVLYSALIGVIFGLMDCHPLCIIVFFQIPAVVIIETIIWHDKSYSIKNIILGTVLTGVFIGIIGGILQRIIDYLFTSHNEPIPLGISEADYVLAHYIMYPFLFMIVNILIASILITTLGCIYFYFRKALTIKE